MLLFFSIAIKEKMRYNVSIKEKDEKMRANIFDIQRNSFVDGPGIRTTVFFKGCNLRCKWCHNPESQSHKIQMLFYRSKCTGCGKCAEICPNHLESCTLCGKCELYCVNDARQICGKEYTVDDVLAEVKKDKIFYDASGGGVTCSGGECMLQIDFLCELLSKCNEQGIHTAVDTAGDVPWKYFEKILPYTDLFLYDVKALSEELHLVGTGVSNKRILENLKRLAIEQKADIIIRIPVIKGFNADIVELKKIKAFLDSIGIKKVELLPYHKMGEHKYEALGIPGVIYAEPSKEEMDEYKKIFGVV